MIGRPIKVLAWQHLRLPGRQWESDDALLVVPSLGRVIRVYFAVSRIAEAWQDLPLHIRTAILTLVHAGVPYLSLVEMIFRQ